MHSYSIDSEERTYTVLVLAVISIVLSLWFFTLFGRYKITLPWWVESPSVLSLFGLIFFIFDKWVWKFCRKIKLIKTPNLNGKWEGFLKSSADQHALEIKATLKIFQTWSDIKITLSTKTSSSKSETASMIITDPEETRLYYHYINEPKAGAVGTMSIHRGTAILSLDEREEILTGDYYSGRNRQNFGSLHFKKTS